MRPTLRNGEKCRSGAKNQELGVLHGTKPDKPDEESDELGYGVCSRNARAVVRHRQPWMMPSVFLSRVPAIGEPGEVPVHQPKNQGHDRELNQELIKENLQEISYRLTASK